MNIGTIARSALRSAGTALFMCAAVCAYAGGTLVYDFETGDLAKEGWTVVQGECTKPIGSRDVEFHNNSTPYDKHGKHYLTTLETTANDNPVDDPVCVVESPVFKIDGDAMKFLVGGGGKREGVRVELDLLKEDGDGEPVLVARGDDSQKLREEEWNVAPYKGKRAFVRVIDLETGGWAHIRCDYFRIPGAEDVEGTLLRRAYFERVAQEERERVEKERQEALDMLPETVLFIRRAQYRSDHHNTATIFQKGEINEKSFVGGAALVAWFVKEDREQVLIETPDGIVRDPCLSFDAKKVLVSVRRSADDDYHIAELDLDFDRDPIVLTADMTREQIAAIKGFRQLTFVKGASDIDPAYLPTGEIVFSSTREPKYCMCNRHIMCNLHRMNADGSGIEQIGKSTLFEGHSAILSDGRILYDRWEYVDRNFGDAQGVWVANPDGTRHEIYWGNNTAAPGGVIDARPLPDDDSLFLCVLGSCHDRPWGAVALIDRRRGLDGKDPVIQTWPPEARELVSDAPAADPFKEAVRYDAFRGISRKYEDPFPLEDGFVLAAGQTGKGEETGIYVLNPDGGAVLVHTDAPGCYDPIPLLETELPKTIANRVDYNDENGYFHVANVYEGYGMDKVEKGSVKYLRVVESPEKRSWTYTDWQGSGTQAPGMAWDDFNNKRVLGTVPVKEDGSVFFAVPAEKFVYFQLLDKDFRMIQSMRSGVMARPGETNACVGCHESKLDAPSSIALGSQLDAGEPEKLTQPLGGVKLYSYLDQAQPVFDKYCATCHDYGKKAGEKLILARDRNLMFNASYWDIRSKGYVRVPGAGPHNVLPAYSWGSTQSKLADVMTNGHENPEIDAKRKELGIYVDLKTDPDAVRTVYEWIDLNAPYYPVYESAYRDNLYGRSPLTGDEFKRLEELTGVKGRELARTVLLDRPQVSPCLNRWGAADAAVSNDYDEAVAIISRGAERLKEQDRGEDPEFCPVAEQEVGWARRYAHFAERAADSRAAIRAGKPLNDLQLDEIAETRNQPK